MLVAVRLPAAEAREFRFVDMQPADSPTVQSVARMDSLLRERTQGRLGISVGHGSTASENYIVGQLRTGLLDMARVNLSAFHSIVPATIVPSLPYLFSSNEHMQRTLDGPIGGRIFAAMEKEGFVGLCFYGMGARSYYSARQPIRSVDDIRGMTVRVQPSEVSVEMIRALGARPLALPFDHADEALKAGVVGAAENSWAAFVATGHHTVAKYFNRTEHSQMPSVLVFSRKVWAELAPADQAALRAAATASVVFMRQRLEAYEALAGERAAKAGVEVVDGVDRKSFAAALVPLYLRLVPDRRLQVMVQEIQGTGEIANVP